MCIVRSPGGLSLGTCPVALVSSHGLYGPLLALGNDGQLMTTCPAQSGCLSCYQDEDLADVCNREKEKVGDSCHPENRIEGAGAEEM